MKCMLQVHPSATDEYIASLFGTHGEVLKVVKTMAHSDHGQGLHCSGHVVMSNEHDAQVYSRSSRDLCYVGFHWEVVMIHIGAGRCAKAEWKGQMSWHGKPNGCHDKEDVRQVRMVHTQQACPATMGSLDPDLSQTLHLINVGTTPSCAC